MADELDRVFEELERRETSTGQAALRPMVLSLIHSSYLRTHDLVDFSRDVVDIVTSAVSVPLAFAEGFLRSFLAIESVSEDDSGRIVIRPKAGASEEEIFRQVNEIAAEIEPDSIYNPVVRANMDLVAEATSLVMHQDLMALGELDADELKEALAELEDKELSNEAREQALLEAEEVRRRIDRVRGALRDYQSADAHPDANETRGAPWEYSTTADFPPPPPPEMPPVEPLSDDELLEGLDG